MDFFKRFLALQKASFKVKKILPYLIKDGSILDFGTGRGGVCKKLCLKNYPLIPLDIKDKSVFDEVKPIIYDGTHIPYYNKHFSQSLLLTVLHHTPDLDNILKEVLRVTKDEIIIIEDVYHNQLQKWITFIADSIVNNEFWGHPHTNKTEQEWENLFSDLGMEVKVKKSYRLLFIFRQVLYVVRVK